MSLILVRKIGMFGRGDRRGVNQFLYTIFHWLHLMAAIAGLGGTIFLRIVVLPTLVRMGDETRLIFQEKAHGKVMVVILHSFGLLLITGFVNMIRAFQSHPTSLYMTLFLVKVLLALGLFSIGLMLVLPSEALKEFQARRPFWLTVNIFLGLAIVFLSAWIRLEGQYGQRPDSTYREETLIEVPDSAAT
jgi:hypothetical protein